MLEKRNFYINGSWVAPKKSSDIEVINPASEKACAVISLGSKDDVNDAVLSAKEAFKTWGYSTREDRIALLETFYTCLLYTSPSPRDRQKSRMPSSA